MSEHSRSISAEAQVERQMVWGGCAAMVIKGKVVMEPLMAQVQSRGPCQEFAAACLLLMMALL